MTREIISTLMLRILLLTLSNRKHFHSIPWHSNTLKKSFACKEANRNRGNEKFMRSRLWVHLFSMNVCLYGSKCSWWNANNWAQPYVLRPESSISAMTTYRYKNNNYDSTNTCAAVHSNGVCTVRQMKCMRFAHIQFNRQ